MCTTTNRNIADGAVFADHRALAVGTKGMLLWDPSNGEVVQTLERKPNVIYGAMGGVPAQNRAYAITEGNVVVWDLGTAKELFRFGDNRRRAVLRCLRSKDYL